jgi:hypothetical protein
VVQAPAPAAPATAAPATGEKTKEIEEAGKKQAPEASASPPEKKAAP